jgi:hypothetical protein
MAPSVKQFSQRFADSFRGRGSSRVARSTSTERVGLFDLFRNGEDNNVDVLPRHFDANHTAVAPGPSTVPISLRTLATPELITASAEHQTPFDPDHCDSLSGLDEIKPPKQDANGGGSLFVATLKKVVVASMYIVSYLAINTVHTHLTSSAPPPVAVPEVQVAAPGMTANLQIFGNAETIRMNCSAFGQTI